MFSISNIQRGNKALYISRERLYLNSEGNVVKANDPSRATLLVAAGGSMPMARAQELGLVEADDAGQIQGETQQNDTQAKAITRAPKNKAVQGPQETK